MHKQRDLIIFAKSSDMNVDAIERTVRSITHILHYTESVEAFCIANEIIDINHYRVINAPYIVQKTINDNLQPFVFISNKN